MAPEGEKFRMILGGRGFEQRWRDAHTSSAPFDHAFPLCTHFRIDFMKTIQQAFTLSSIARVGTGVLGFVHDTFSRRCGGAACCNFPGRDAIARGARLHR